MSQDDLRSYFKWRAKRSAEAIRELGVKDMKRFNIKKIMLNKVLRREFIISAVVDAQEREGSGADRHKAVKAYNRIQEEINERAINGPNVPGLK